MRLWQAIGMMVAFGVAIAVVLFVWWDFDVRWRPHELTKNSDQIMQLLSAAGWVSSGGGANKLYVVAVRDCTPCEHFDKSEVPALEQAGTDVRVIMIAPADQNGKPASSPAERSTVAELWVNRSWALYQAWMAASPKTWAAPNIPPADGDAARSAVVETARDLAARLKPLFGSNGVSFAYPIIVWRSKDGTLEAASGDRPKTWADALKDLGAR